MNELKSILKKQGRNNIWLAGKMDKTTQTISNWCTNSSQPSGSDAKKLCDILEIKINELYK